MDIITLLSIINYCIYFSDGSNRGSRVGGNSASPRTASSILNNSYQSSRRNSIDSLDESTPNFRDLRVRIINLYIP